MARSAFDELVVADAYNGCLRPFSSSGDLLATAGGRRFTGVVVVVHVFAVDDLTESVSVFQWRLSSIPLSSIPL